LYIINDLSEKEGTQLFDSLHVEQQALLLNP